MNDAIAPVAAHRPDRVLDLLEQASTPSQTVLGEVDADVQARFAELLGGPAAATEVDGDALRVAQNGEGQLDPWVIVPEGAAERAANVPTVADRILGGVVGVRDSWAEAVANMQELGALNDFGPQEMLRMQFQLGQTTVMLTVVSQEVSKISQKIDGLLKAG